MRAGRLTTKRYKTRKRGWGWLLALIAGFGIGAAAATFRPENWQVSLPVPFVTVPASPTRPPEETQAEERTLTLPGRSWYALQVGAFDSQEAAQSLAASFQNRGAAGYVLRQDTYRVLAAAYPARADAQAVVSQLKNQHQVDAIVTDVLQPEVTLRLSGQKGQLTALGDAYDALNQLAEHLSALSLRLDQRTMDSGQILSAIRSERETLLALSGRLESWFGSEAPKEVGQVKALLDDLCRSLDDCLSTQGNTALGARIKYAQLQCICRMAAYAAGLAL